MPSGQKIAREIVAREGGYVNDPDDPGGGGLQPLHDVLEHGGDRAIPRLGPGH